MKFKYKPFFLTLFLSLTHCAHSTADKSAEKPASTQASLQQSTKQNSAPIPAQITAETTPNNKTPSEQSDPKSEWEKEAEKYFSSVKFRHPNFTTNEFGLPIAIETPQDKPLTEVFSTFFASLKRAEEKKGQSRIVFYGASHVASDYFTGYIREKLQTKLGDSGHGFILPVKPWRYYRHRHIILEDHPDKEDWQTHKVRVNTSEVDHYGLAGVALETNEKTTSAVLRTLEDEGIGNTANHFEIFYLKQPKGGSFQILIDGKPMRVRKYPEPKYWVSTRKYKKKLGYQKIHLKDDSHTFQIKTKGNGPVRIFGVAAERKGEPGVIVDTLGINGARARYHLLWDEKTYIEHLQKRKPDLLVLAYGTNECGDNLPIETYKAQLKKVVNRARNTVPKADCLLIGPSDRPVRLMEATEEEPAVYGPRPRTQEIVNAQRQVALESGCGFFDLVAFQGGPMSMTHWAQTDPAYAAPDHIHYTRRGYERLGQMLLEAMLEGSHFEKDFTSSVVVEKTPQPELSPSK